ncbi:MAG: hypothetical protein HY900_28290 [Deltaproteobacteria bacterium]|nr:hypothetical protein [Deltaproteobacteria bacterium]
MGVAREVGLEVLLSLDGEVYRLENGYWTKFEVKRVSPTAEVPHGIHYNLTFHDRFNTRVLGFDNAHAVKPQKKKYSARKLTWDHKHDREVVEPYEFESPAQLLEDFWNAAEQIMSS